MTERAHGEGAKAAARDEDDLPSLDLDLDRVCFIIVTARVFNAKEEVVEPDYGSNAADDQFRAVLEAYADDPSYQELVDAIDAMSPSEQCRLVALAWVGRGTYGIEDWQEAVAAAEDGHTERTGTYLAAMPLLADYLEEGLEAFGRSCADVEEQHL